MSEDVIDIPPFVQEAIITIYDRLLARDYERVVELTRGVRIPAADIARRLHDDYRAEIIPFEPDDFWKTTQVLGYRPVGGREVNFWHVNFPLFLAGEGRSDVIVSIGVGRADDGSMSWELRDIRAM